MSSHVMHKQPHGKEGALKNDDKSLENQRPQAQALVSVPKERTEEEKEKEKLCLSQSKLREAGDSTEPRGSSERLHQEGWEFWEDKYVI